MPNRTADVFSGWVRAESGADGFATNLLNNPTHVNFAYEEGQVLNTTIGAITIHMEKGTGTANSNAIITGMYTKENGEETEAFVATIDNSGKWNCQMYESFHEIDANNKETAFALKFVTEDGDGDIAHVNAVLGTNAAEMLMGGGYDDVLHAGDGNDIMVYDANDAMIDGGSGIDVLLVNSENDLDSLFSANNIRGVEMIIGATAKDTIEMLENLTNMDALREKLGVSEMSENAFEQSANWELTIETSVAHTYTNHDLGVTVAIKQIQGDQGDA